MKTKTNLKAGITFTYGSLQVVYTPQKRDG
jgi:hypothetical protein